MASAAPFPPVLVTGLSTRKVREKYYTEGWKKPRHCSKKRAWPKANRCDLLVTDFGGSGFYTGAGVVWKEQLARIGIDVQIRLVEQGVYIQEASPDGNWNYDVGVNAFSHAMSPTVLSGRASQKHLHGGLQDERMDEILLPPTPNSTAKSAMPSTARRRKSCSMNHP